MDLNYMIADEWLEMFESLSNSGQTEFLRESFLQKVPPDFIEEINFLELIITHYEYLKKEKQYDKIIELQNLINEHNAELFGENKFYADEYIAEIYIFKNEEERIKESMSSFLEKPVESCVRVAETMDLNYMITDEWLEMFESLTNSGQTEFLRESFLQEVPPDFIEEINFLELIITHYEYLKKEKQYDKIIELQNLINEHNAKLFGENKFYADEYIAEIYIFKNEEERIKESMSSFLEKPVESMDELIPLVNKLVYYDHSEFVQLICEKVYDSVKNEREFMASGEKFTRIIKMFLLQALCRQICEAEQAIDKNTYITAYLDKMQEYGIGKDEVDVFIQTILGIEGNLNSLNNAEKKSSFNGNDSNDAPNNDSGNNIEDNPNANGEEDDQELFNTLLSLFCIDVLYNKNINFATASDIWTGAWESFSLENYSDGISGEANNSFKLNKESFRDLITDGFSLLSNLKSYTFAVVWGLPYVYDFLQKYRLINIKDYNEAQECINNVKMQLIEGFSDDLWEYNFVHTWQRPDSISAKKYLKEKELFTEVFVEEVDIEEYLSKQFSSEENVADKIFLLDAEQMKEWRQKRAHTVRNNEPKVGRNESCPCGSGKKFKKCCGK